MSRAEILIKLIIARLQTQDKELRPEANKKAREYLANIVNPEILGKKK